MKFCAIAPINKLKDTRENIIHMALTHLCDDPKYVQFFQREKEAGKFIILDNSIIELGSACTIEKVLSAAEKIGADEIVLPDVFLEGKKTVEEAKKYVDLVHDKGYRVMAVAHGRTIEEWSSCALELVKLKVDTLGIPKVLSKQLNYLEEPGRVACLIALGDICEKNNLMPPTIHLLGIDNNPLEVGYIYNLDMNGKIPTIRSCDSAISFVYAAFDTTFAEADPETFMRPDMKIDFFGSGCDDATHLRNIMHCRQCCGDDMRFQTVMAEDIYNPWKKKKEDEGAKRRNIFKVIK